MSPIGWPKKKSAKEEDRKRIVEKGTTSKVAEEKQKEREAIFKGLDETEINALYSMAHVLRMKPGDFLFQEGDIDQRVFVILEGKIRITQTIGGITEELVKLSPGTWMGDTGFARARRTTSAAADTDAAVMALDRDTINSLENKTQLYFYKRLSNLSSLKVSQLEAQRMEQTAKNSQLAEALVLAKTGHRTDLEKSELIQAVIQTMPKLPAFVNALSMNWAGVEDDAAGALDRLYEAPELLEDVLKKINSSYFAFPEAVEDIKSAALSMGVQALYRTVVAEGVRRAMPNTFEFDRLHAQAVTISHIAYALSACSQKSAPVLSATIGLVHNIGQTVMALIKKINPGASAFIDAVEHPALGALLLREWNLPEAVCFSVECLFHPDIMPPSKISEDILNHVTILYMARLCHDVMQGKSERYMPMLYFDDYKRLLKWDKLTPEDILLSHALPFLRKKTAGLPDFLRQVLKQYE